MALIAVLLLVTAAPAVGWITGSSTDASLRQSIRTQHQLRHEVVATVVGDAPLSEAAAYDPESAAREERRPVIAHWTAADGSTHTGKVHTTLRSTRAGDTFPVWTDGSGRLVHRPMDPEAARVHAALAGIGAALLSAAVVGCAARLVVWRLVRRRHARLDHAWATVGPDWGRAGAGS